MEREGVGMSDHLKVLIGDCRETLAKLEPNSVQCCVTSPPYYGLRDYGHDGQIGLEQTPDEYVAEMVKVFSAVKRVLKDDGVCFVNLGDSYAGSGKGSNPDGTVHESALTGKQGTHKGTTEGITKPQKAKEIGLKQKDIIGIPWRVAFALQADGWYLRQDIIWHKPNPMPESVKDRCTKAHEYVFLLSKSPRYYWDADAIKDDAVWGGYKDAKSFGGKNGIRFGGNKYGDSDDPAYRTKSGNVWVGKGTEKANKRSVWSITTQPYSGAHFATMPPKLAETCVLAGTKAGDIVLDPFGGSGTTGMVAIENGRRAILCELNESYVELIHERTNVTVGFGF